MVNFQEFQNNIQGFIFLYVQFGGVFFQNQFPQTSAKPLITNPNCHEQKNIQATFYSKE